MCVVSNVGDYWREQTLPRKFPWVDTYPTPGSINIVKKESEVSKEDFDALKKNVEELKKLLLAAKMFDEQSGEHDCETDEKVELIRKIAKALDVDLEGII